MGFIDTIKEKVKSFITGASTEDLLNLVKGDSETLTKLIKDEKFRKGVLTRLEEFQSKYPDKPIKQEFLKTVYVHLNSNKSARSIITREILTKPDYSKMNILEGLIDLTKAKLTPEEIQVLRSKNIPEEQYAFVKALKEFKLLTDKDFKKEKTPHYIETNLKTTWQQFQKYKQITTTIDKLSDALDVFSLVTAVGGGVGSIITIGLKKAGKTVAQRYLAKSVATTFLTSDVSFLSSIGLKLTNDVVIKHQNPSTWDIVFGLLGLSPFITPVGQKINKVVKKHLEPPVTIDNLKNIQHLAPYTELSHTLSTVDRAIIRRAVLNTLESQNYVGKNIEISKKLEPAFRPLVESFVKALGDETASKFARFYIRPFEVSVVKKTKKELLQQFVEKHLDDFKAIYKNLGNKEELQKIFAEKPEFVDFFKSIVTSKYYVNRFRYEYKKFLQTAQRLKLEIPEGIGKQIFAVVGKEGDTFTFKLEDLFHNPDTIRDFEEFIGKQIKQGKAVSDIQWYYKHGDNVIELSKAFPFAKFPDSMINIYIPSSDFPQAFRVIFKNEEGALHSRVVYLPNEFVEQIFKKTTNIQDAYRNIKDYIKQYILPEAYDLEIVERFKPPTHLFPTKEIFYQVFGKEEVQKLDKLEKHLSKLDDILAEVKDTGILLKEFEKRKNEIRTKLKELAENVGVEFKKQIKTETLAKRLQELGHLDDEIAKEVQSILEEIRNLKTSEIVIDSKLAKKIGGLLEKIDKTTPEIDMRQAYENFIDLLMRKPWDMKRTSIEGFLKFDLLPDREAQVNYLTNSFLRSYALEENILLGNIAFVDNVIKEYFGDTAFGKTWELIRAYHFSKDVKGQVFKFLGKLSRLFTIANPSVSFGAYIQVKTGLSMLFPSYKVATSLKDITKEILTNKAFAKEFIKDLKSSKILDTGHYLPSLFKYFETFLENDLKLALLKNKEFADEVARYFGFEKITPDMVEHVAKIIGDLIDNPASLGMLFGGSKITHGLAVVQSWYPFIVAPFQIASTSLLKSFKGPDRIKYLRNALYLTLLGSTFLPSTISQITAPIETVRKMYEEVVSPVIAFFNFLHTGQKTHETWLENRDPIIERAVKTLISNVADIPLYKLSGRILTDLGQVLALHGDENHFNYIAVGLQKLVNVLSKFDITDKGLVTSGSVSTAFDFTFPVINTALNLISAFIDRYRTTPQQFWQDIIVIANRIIPIFRNLKYGLFQTMSSYGPQKDVTLDKILADFVKDLVEDERVGFLTGLGYNIGVLLSHPQAFMKMFDIIYNHSFLTHAKHYVEDLFTEGEPRKIEYVYLPKVRSFKDFQNKIVGKEDLILMSIDKTENKEALLSALQTYFNVVKNKYQQGLKEYNLEEEKQILRSLATIAYKTMYKHQDLAPVITESFNNILEDMKKRYGEDATKILLGILEEIKIKYKIM